MSFIGIVTNPKNKDYIEKEIFKTVSNIKIFFITNKNIKNMRNVKFETIVINEELDNTKELKNIISNCKYIILNEDLVLNKAIFKNMNLTIISYGFNNKSTFTISSISENNIIICLQRIIENIFEQKNEPQEFNIKRDKNTDIYTSIETKCVEILYSQIPIFSI